MRSSARLVGAVHNVPSRSVLGFHSSSVGFGGIERLLSFGLIGDGLEFPVLRDSLEVAYAGTLHRERRAPRLAGPVVADQTVGSLP